jgi:hypothetical protein
MYQGNVSQLILQPGEKLSEEKNGLATLVRIYCCAMSYVSTAKSILVPGYSPSDYPLMGLFKAPDETFSNGIAYFACTFYGVLDSSKYNAPYDYFETEIASGSMKYVDLNALDGSMINYDSTSVYETGIYTTDSFQYLSPLLIRSLVIPKSSAFPISLPTISDFLSFQFLKFSSSISKGSAVTSAFREMDLQRWAIRSGGNFTPIRSTIKDYGCVNELELIYSMQIPQSTFSEFSVGSGTLANRQIYYPINFPQSVPSVTLTANHDTYVKVSWPPVTLSDEFPIVGYTTVTNYDPGESLVGVDNYQQGTTKTFDKSQHLVTDSQNQQYYSLGSQDLLNNSGTNAAGFYQVSVQANHPYSQGPAASISFIMPGNPLPPVIENVTQNYENDITGESNPSGSFALIYKNPYWDGFSDANSKGLGITSIEIKYGKNTPTTVTLPFTNGLAAGATVVKFLNYNSNCPNFLSVGNVTMQSFTATKSSVIVSKTAV